VRGELQGAAGELLHEAHRGGGEGEATAPREAHDPDALRVDLRLLHQEP
jgi:hypothetical protein